MPSSMCAQARTTHNLTAHRGTAELGNAHVEAERKFQLHANCKVAHRNLYHCFPENIPVIILSQRGTEVVVFDSEGDSNEDAGLDQPASTIATAAPIATPAPSAPTVAPVPSVAPTVAQAPSIVASSVASAPTAAPARA
ncbi:hypothetical protein CF326_g5914 [Tilletia indica]|nr:hypothetical protein CF326_g5914 [Tilletia indica]